MFMEVSSAGMEIAVSNMICLPALAARVTQDELGSLSIHVLGSFSFW